MNLLNLESELATRIEYRVKNAIGTQFPKLNFSTEISDIPAEFPNVYIHEERLTETGNTLEGKTFNAVDFAMQDMKQYLQILPQRLLRTPIKNKF